MAVPHPSLWHIDAVEGASTPSQQEQQKNQPVESRFKIDHAASPMPQTRQPERFAPGRDQIGIPGRDHRNRQAEIVIIATRTQEYGELASLQVASKTVFDARRLLNPADLAAADYLTIGRRPN
ncbi:hypothetical protein HAP41_0000047955 (plasmid) [Bradyrhizobium barranii subsp. apii]|uniref:Uncharacterized protein n=1 Tax=Bradyrhizobium barranii subsp. apii TaxID=2819348 RepID=A0A8T5VLZ0_9BRAD|nr:hypothetical protein [Bradyrhizobium barranii]UPT92286.1 hypothetical protein HAP41_0000047955 [Bradyrhizobium barranii subsp. apii]